MRLRKGAKANFLCFFYEEEEAEVKWRWKMSFHVSVENCQGLSIPGRGGKIIPPARNGERKRSGTWFCASLWWHHEASLTRRSQTSWGDVDCYNWVEVGGCWACSCSICKHQCLELDANCNWEPVQGDKERCTWAFLGSLKTNRAAALYMELFEVRVLVLYQFLPITSNRLLWRPVSNNHIWVTRQHTVLCFY